MGLASSPLFRDGKLKDKEKIRDLLKVSKTLREHQLIPSHAPLLPLRWGGLVWGSSRLTEGGQGED